MAPWYDSGTMTSGTCTYAGADPVHYYYCVDGGTADSYSISHVTTDAGGTTYYIYPQHFHSRKFRYANPRPLQFIDPFEYSDPSQITYSDAYTEVEVGPDWVYDNNLWVRSERIARYEYEQTIDVEQISYRDVLDVYDRFHAEIEHIPDLGVREETEEDRAERQRAVQVREDRGEAYLKDVLGDDNYALFQQQGFIDVQSEKDPLKRYRIRPNRRIGIVKFEDNEWVEKALSLCIHPANQWEWVRGDLIVTHIMLARYNEDMLEQVANLHSMAA